MIQKEDLIASLVVFIIALPLSLGIALASGGPPAAGLIAAVIGGIVAGLFAGAPLVVTGPAAGLTALVFQMVQQFGLEGLAIITVLCGAFQVLMGGVRAGRMFSLIPRVVLEGVLSAIGLIIVLGQIHVLMGQGIPKSPVLSLAQIPESTMMVFSSAEGFVAPVFLCGLLALAVQLLWPRVAKKISWLPGALPAVVIVTLVSLLWEMPRVTLAPLLPTMQAAGLKFLDFSWMQHLGSFALPAAGLAIVASAESLLTARAIDLHIADKPWFRHCNLNRELVAQGMANVASGVLGGLPMTAVMVRSAANVNAGGRSRWSTVLHGVWIAAFVGGLPFVLAKIPLTALAAILILTGVKLINLKHMIATIKNHKVEGGLWVFTSAAVFATDLLKGLVMALVVYAIIHHRLIVAHVKKIVSETAQGQS